MVRPTDHGIGIKPIAPPVRRTAAKLTKRAAIDHAARYVTAPANKRKRSNPVTPGVSGVPIYKPRVSHWRASELLETATQAVATYCWPVRLVTVQLRMPLVPVVALEHSRLLPAPDTRYTERFPPVILPA